MVLVAVKKDKNKVKSSKDLGINTLQILKKRTNTDLCLCSYPFMLGLNAKVNFQDR